MIVALACIGVFISVVSICAGVTHFLERRARQNLPRVGRLIQLRGAAIHLHEIGATDAPTVVLIHGLYGQLQHFTFAMADILAKHFRVVLIDRPGCGYSRRDDTETPAQQGALIAEVLDICGYDQPILVGHSLGAAVAVEMALAQPKRYGGLALLAPAVAAVNTTPMPILRGLLAGVKWVAPVVCATLAAPVAHLFRALFWRASFFPEPVPDTYRLSGGAELGLLPSALRWAGEDMVTLTMTAPQRVANLDRISAMPKAVLFAQSDLIVPPETQKNILGSDNWDHKTIAARGHMLPITAPQACADLVKSVSKRARSV
jgi:pimeloyl-ACP methyl ester carboxylesterase